MTTDRRAALRFKPKAQQVRLSFSDTPAMTDIVTSNPGKVFAVIGPFDEHTDKPDLQDMLVTLLRGYNLDEP